MVETRENEGMDEEMGSRCIEVATYFTDAIKVKVLTVANIPYMRREGQVGVDGDTKTYKESRKLKMKLKHPKVLAWSPN
jgi:hypothetical protein